MGAMEDKNTSNNTNVQSVGNSWIIRKSKRYLGHVYYFNTLTGQSVWNLSEQEMQKAKQKTQSCDHQKNSLNLDFPEPIEPPAHMQQLPNKPNCSCMTPSESSICNKDLTHNQMRNPVYTVVHCCCGSRQDQAHPTCSRNYNNVYCHPALNHCERISVAKTKPSDLHSEQILHENCEDCNKKPFNHTMECHTSCGHSNRSEMTYNLMNQEQSNGQEYVDLREKIFKKKILLRKATDNCIKSNIESMRCSVEQNCNTNEKDVNNKNIFEEYKTLEKLKLDMRKLRLLADDKFSTWFMVLDSSVLLHYDVTHIDFLQLLLRSDERCRVVIPQHVLVEVQAAAVGGATRLAALASRAHRYLNNLLDRDIALIGPEPSKNDYLNKNHIIRCCLKLYEEKLPVILLSEETNLIEETSRIPIFSIQKLKEFLEYQSKQHSNIADFNNRAPMETNCIVNKREINGSSENLKNTEHQSKEDSNINDLYNKVPMEVNSFIVNNIVDKANSKYLKNTDHQPKGDTNFYNTVPMDMNSTTVDVMVDKNKKITDNQPKQDSNLNINDINSKVPLKVISDIVIRNADVIVTSENVKSSEIQVKKRKICLKRNLTPAKSSNSGEIRNFKWRAKRFKKNNSNGDSNQIQKHLKDMYTQTQQDNEHNNDVNLEKKTCSQKLGDQQITVNISPKNNSMDDNMDSSESSNIRKNPGVNVNVEETSTSGVISNSFSNIDSDSEQGNYSKYVRNDGTNLKNNVMFEVRDTTMAEQLKTGRDEWLSRFVQIMEEVLTEVLQQDPPFFEKSMPPPWSLHEAAICISKKFRANADIQKAANKLVNHVFNVSDYRGKMNINMTPSNFMEMYSYGVHLVNTLQTKFGTNEDLKNASLSLEKLLRDIEDSPHPCDTSRDQFSTTDFTADSYSCRDDRSDRFLRLSPVNNIENFKHKRDNLKARKLVEDYVNSINNVKRGEFFSTLNLAEEAQSTREPLSSAIINHSPSKTKCLVTLDESQKNTSQWEQSTDNNEDSLQKDTVYIKNINDDPSNNDDPATKQNIVFKITRTFNKCPEFEEKIKRNGLLSEEIYEEENMEDQYYSEDFIDEEQASDDSYDHSSSCDRDGIVETEELDDFFKGIIGKTQKTLTLIYDFCRKATEELNNSKDRTSTSISRIQRDLKLYKVEVLSLDSCLKRIFKREIAQFKAELEQLGVKTVPEEQQIKYRQAIKMCMNETNILSEAIEELSRLCCT